MKSEGPIRFLSLVWAGAAIVACDSGMEPLDPGEEAMVRALETGDYQGLRLAASDYLGGEDVSQDIELPDDMDLERSGLLWGNYGPPDRDASRDQGEGIFLGHFMTFDLGAEGLTGGRGAEYDSGVGGAFEGRARSLTPLWRGQLSGRYSPWSADRGVGMLAASWYLDQGEEAQVVGAWRGEPRDLGGRFAAIFSIPDLEQEEPEPTVHRLKIVNEIDGRSTMTIGTYKAHYHHLDYAAPGMHYYFGEGQPYSEPARPAFIREYEWYPLWPEDGENRDCDCDSSALVTEQPDDVLVPYDEAEISLEVHEGRGEVTILEYPTRDNGYSMTLEWDDNPFSGPAWYEVEITFTTY